MLFSIIVPLYNVEKYIKECVESVLSQTYKDFELILVDDGSPDSCPKICDDYAKKDSRVKVIHKPNGGPSDARNAGIEVAKGDYLLFLDGDDSLKDENVLLKLKEDLLNENLPEVMLFNENGFYENLTPNNGEMFLSEVLKIWNRKKTYDVVVWNKVFKRDYIVEKTLRFVKGYVHEDDYWTPIAIFNASKCALTTVNICNHRLNETSITRTKNDKSLYNRIISKINLSRKSIDYFNSVNCTKTIKEENLKMCSAMFLGAIVNSFKIEDKKLKKNFIRELRANKIMFKFFGKTNLKKYKKLSFIYKLTGLKFTLFFIKTKVKF